MSEAPINNNLKVRFFRGIFWKIFLAFWLASLLILFASTFALLHQFESERTRLDHENRVARLVERVLARDLQGKRLERQVKRFARGRKHFIEVLEVYENGQLLFNYADHPNAPQPDIRFSMITADERQLEVRTSAPKLPRFVVDLIKKIHLVHLASIIIASTLVSLLLSWSITRPLKKLGRSSRIFASGQVNEIEAALTGRADEIGQLARDMDFMMAAVQNAMSSQQQLLHNVSHELRAPLARLQVAAELIQQQEQKERPQLEGGDIKNSHVERIHEECEKLDALIQRILSFSKIEQNASLAEFDVAQLVARCASEVAYEYPQRNLVVKADIADCVIQGRAELLAQAVENIIRNACKYSPEAQPVEIEVSMSSEHIEIKITDFGRGVAPAELNKLQEPFYRGGQKMHGEGYGLGLSIARKAVEAHRGKLDFYNKQPSGFSVIITLPRRTEL